VAALIVALSATLIAACGTPSSARSQDDMTRAPASMAIEGVAAYRERIALPPGASFEATLEDVSRADAPALQLGQAIIADPRSPIRFSIPFDPAEIAPERTYAVRARIVVNGQLWFTSDSIHRVLTRGAGTSVEIPLKSVRPQATKSQETSR
jgi:putative lipoprotein